MTEAEATSLMKAIAPVLHAHIKAATEPRLIGLAECISELVVRVSKLEDEIKLRQR